MALAGGGGKDEANGRQPRGRKPGQRRRDELEKRRDRREIVQLKLRQKLHSEEIAEIINARYYRTKEEDAYAEASGKRPAHVSPAQVRVELKLAAEEYQRDTTDDILTIRLELCREFEDLEAYAWSRYYATLEAQKEVETEEIVRKATKKEGEPKPQPNEGEDEDAGERASQEATSGEPLIEKHKTVTERNTDGDRGYLELALRCKEMRLRILGAEPPRKIAPTNPQGTKPYEFEQPEEFKRLAALAIDLLPDLKDLLK